MLIDDSTLIEEVYSSFIEKLMATRQGEVKRVDIRDFANLRANGLICFDLEPSDELRWAMLTDGNQECIMVTRMGKSIRYHESDIPVRGRPAGGVRGIEMRDENKQLADTVVAVDLVDPSRQLLVVGERGVGKRSDLSLYRIQSRGGRGIITMEVTEKTGPVVAATVVTPADRLMLITVNGVAIRMEVNEIRAAGRSTQGVRLQRMEPDDSVASIEVLRNDEVATDEIPAARPGSD